MASKAYKFEFQFEAGNDDRLLFSDKLSTFEDSDFLIYTDPTEAEKWVYSHARSFDLIVNTVVMVVSTAGGVAAIAQLIFDILEQRKRKNEARPIVGIYWGKNPPPNASEVVFKPPENQVLVKQGSKIVRISGDFSKDEILAILQKAAATHRKNADAWIQKRKTHLRIQEIEQELRHAQWAIGEYNKLLEVFENDKPLSSDQKQAYVKYKKQKAYLCQQASRLRKELKRLKSKEVPETARKSEKVRSNRLT